MLSRPDGEEAGREDVGEQHWRTDHLDPVAADGVLGVVSQDAPSSEDGVLIKNFPHNLQGVIFSQFVLVKVVEQQLQSIHYLIPVQLEVFRTVLEQMYEIFNDLIDLDVLDLVGDMLLQIGIRLGSVSTLFLI